MTTAIEGHNFKKSGVIRGAFEYQDLVAIEVLIDFLLDSELYQWVSIEEEEAEFRAIDDVVACRKDGKFELTQVKFTPDPTARDYQLDWNWLTAHRPTGTSLIQKWAKTTLAHLENGTLAQSMLKTDRRPSSDFINALDGEHIVYANLPSHVKQVLLEQIGSASMSVTFFEWFKFKHSMPRLADLEHELRSRLEYDTDNRGWALFKEKVRNWSTHKRVPRPEGKIRHYHLVQIFSPQYSRTLDQDFTVPSDYSVPDEEFHQAFFNRCMLEDGVTVLWGPPGRGKSTFLSHCVAQWSGNEDVVCIRHHYFIQSNDRAEPRFSYFAISRSLIQQLKDTNLFSMEDETLGKVVEQAATEVERTGKKLIVVIDGLDHVWRARRDIVQLEDLFRQLLPLPKGMHLVVGTQKVEDRHLPGSLLIELPKNQWTELPSMSVHSIRKWLTVHCSLGRLPIEKSRFLTQEQLIEVLGTEFHRISGGLPLHLVYSLEALLKSGQSLTVNSVTNLPPCPTGKIEDYYELLWVRLAVRSKRLLHLLAGLKFNPPVRGLRFVLTGKVDWLEAEDEIGHLLEYHEVSVNPFHSSLFAFLRQRPEHREEFETLLPRIVHWLENEAPEYWRNSWLWITRKQLGDSSMLISGPTRRWAVNWIKAAYPLDQLINIVNQAEEAALNANDFRNLVRLRSLKERAVYAREYQTQEWYSFLEIILSVSEDQDLLAVFRDSILQMRVQELPAIADCGSKSVRRRVIDELNRRITSQSRKSHGNSEGYANAIIRVVALDSKEQAKNVIEYAERRGEEGLIEVYARESVRAGNFENALAVGQLRSWYGLDRLSLAAFCSEDIGPSDRSGFISKSKPAIQCLGLIRDSKFVCDVPDHDVTDLLQRTDEPGFGLRIQEAGYHVFFCGLVASLSGSKAEGLTKMGEDRTQSRLRLAIQEFERLADLIGSTWRKKQQWLPLEAIYRNFFATSNSELTRTEMIGTRLALRDIAADLCTIGVKVLSKPRIDAKDIRVASKSPFWSTELWLETFWETSLPLHSSSGARAVIELVSSRHSKKIIQFDEKVETLIKTTRFALNHGLKQELDELVNDTIECLLGYGWHRDNFVFDITDSLRLLADKGDSEVTHLLLSLAKEIDSITEYTDGETTYQAREEFHQMVVNLLPERVSKLYAELVSLQEWHYAGKIAVMYVERLSKGSNVDLALLATFITPWELHKAWEVLSRIDPDCTYLRPRLTRFGGKSESARDRKTTDFSSTLPSSASPIKIDPHDFPPGKLAALVAFLKKEKVPTHLNPVADWLEYWDTQGRSAKALVNMKMLIEETPIEHFIVKALDKAFEVSRRREGRTKAFPWLVRAQKESKGWIRGWSSFEAFENRVNAVARDYPEKWREFVEESCRTEYTGGLEDNGITVGIHRLVYLLLHVDEIELAKTLIKDMVDTFRDQLSQQPLTLPEWAR